MHGKVGVISFRGLLPQQHDNGEAAFPQKQDNEEAALDPAEGQL